MHLQLLISLVVWKIFFVIVLAFADLYVLSTAAATSDVAILASAILYVAVP